MVTNKKHNENLYENTIRNRSREENGLRGRLKFTAEVKDYAGSVVERLKRDGKKFVQFGAGTTGASVVRYLKKNGLNPLCFCDNNPMKQGTELDGLRVFSLDSVKNEYGSDVSFVISCNAFKEISKQLIQGGVQEDNIICFEPDWLNLPQGQGAYIQEHLADFEEVYDMLADEKSKDVFCGLLNFKITHDLGYISGLPDDLPYFDGGLYTLNGDMVFLDCGAFIGDTLQDFLRLSNGKYGRVACFEPNPDNVRYIREYISKNKLDKVDLFEYGVSDKKQRLSFGGASDAGRIQKDGDIIIECDSIDNLCFEKYPRVDLIKMDIEGSEFWALKGAGRVIQRDKPILAVCVYHKKDDFFVLPKLIKELNPNYKLYFRQYELSGQETVCIAVP